MTLIPRFANVALSSKIVLLVGLRGVVSVTAMVYALVNMRSIDQQYRALSATEARSALNLSDAALHLSDASRLVYTVLTEPDEGEIRAALASLAMLKIQFNAKLQQTAWLLPGKAGALDAVEQQSTGAFALASHIVDSAARWRGSTPQPARWAPSCCARAWR